MKEGNRKSVDKKKLLYTICFVMLNLIDFVRHTQQQSLWGPLVNVSGILLLVMIAGTYKRQELMSRFACVWTGLVVCLLLTSALWKTEHIFGVYKWTVFTALLNVWLIGILGSAIAVKRLRQKRGGLRWKLPAVLWGIMMLCALVSPYRALWSVWFLAIFSLFYLTRFEKSDFLELCEAMADGTVIAFLLLQIYACGYRPYDEVRYKGAFSNCNMTALHYLVAYLAVLTKLHFLRLQNSAKKWRLLYGLVAVGLLDLLILTMTRTAWVVAAVITFLYGMLILYRFWRESGKVIIGRGCLLGICTLLLFPAVFAAVRWLPPLRHHPVWYAGEWSEEKVHSFDPPDSEKYIDFEEVVEELFGRTLFFKKADNPFVLKAYAAEKEKEEVIEIVEIPGLPRSLYARISIYRAYLADLNWQGHDSGRGHFYIEESDRYVWHPQNVWIYVAYYWGIPAGVIFVILTVLILVKQVRTIKRDRENTPAVVALLLTLVFFGYGLMEIVWLPGQFILFLFLFAQHPQFGEENGKRLP